MPSSIRLPVPSVVGWETLGGDEFRGNVGGVLSALDELYKTRQSRDIFKKKTDEWISRFCFSAKSMEAIRTWIASSCHVSPQLLTEFPDVDLVGRFLDVIASKDPQQTEDLLNNLQITVARGSVLNQYARRQRSLWSEFACDVDPSGDPNKESDEEDCGSPYTSPTSSTWSSSSSLSSGSGKLADHLADHMHVDPSPSSTAGSPSQPSPDSLAQSYKKKFKRWTHMLKRSLIKQIPGFSSPAFTGIPKATSHPRKRKRKAELEEGEVVEPKLDLDLDSDSDSESKSKPEENPPEKPPLEPEPGEVEQDDNVFDRKWQEDVDELVTVLQEMKGVTKSGEYSHPKFTETFLKSKCAKVIAHVSNPAFLARYPHPGNLKLKRLYGFTDVLGEHFDTWIFPGSKPLEGEELRKAEERTRKHVLNPLNFVSNASLLQPMQDAADFMEALTNHPSLIPNGSDPMGVLFLYTENIFLEEWYRWVGVHLCALGYKVNETQPVSLYRGFWQHVRKLKTNQFERLPCLLRLIIEKTHDLREARDALRKKTHTKQTSEDNAFGHDTFLHKPIETYLSSTEVPRVVAESCKKCLNEADLAKKCFQYVYVHSNAGSEWSESLRGHGVSMVPPGECMNPVDVKPKKAKTTRKSHGKSKGVGSSSGIKEIKSFDELNLRWIAPDEKTLERCQRITFFFMDEVKPDQKIDFLVYNAFPDKEFKQMVQNSQEASLTKPVRRGSQFAHWGTGVMYPWGKRVPAGGRKADTYAYYAGIESDQFDGVEAMFRIAYDSMVILTVAELYHADLVKSLKAAGKSCGMEGIGGINSFQCNNYTAPLHSDEDAVPSLCCQLERYGVKEEYGEYGFCQVDYGYAFATRENTLWSFDSSKLHGTLLPSQHTIEQTTKTVICIGEHMGKPALTVRPAAISRGSHKTVRKKDAARAAKLQSVRANWERRSIIVNSDGKSAKE
ncbi:hypothetical protein PQX77_014134 [Marasmius sp. AFHP31]|nr:hypothetical protein PQX77_014134 [Marasmius sp. AFHP31]